MRRSLSVMLRITHVSGTAAKVSRPLYVADEDLPTFRSVVLLNEDAPHLQSVAYIVAVAIGAPHEIGTRQICPSSPDAGSVSA